MESYDTPKLLIEIKPYSEHIEAYKALLEYSYRLITETYECPPQSRLDYLGEYIFDFTTYDSDASELFASKAIEVCAAINNRTTFDYIEDKNDYNWFLLMCNMPFFIKRLTWGMSIRGAWWDVTNGIKFYSTGLYQDNKQLMEIEFNDEAWKQFITAIVDFSNEILK